jgi:hypothetical protein
MPFMNAHVAVAVAVAAVLWINPKFGQAGPLQAHPQQVQATATQHFYDPVFGYTVRFPAAWHANQVGPSADKLLRLSLQTPNQGLIVLSVSRLPRRVTEGANFITVASDYVDPIVKSYLEWFKITSVLGSQKRDRSNATAMVFWQGTSALGGVMVSQHTIRFGTDFMVNIFYTSADKPQLKDELQAIESVMASLSFHKDR